MLDREKVKEKVIELLNSTKRKFTQSVELIVNLKNIDLKKPENKINELIVLPYKSEKSKVVVISDEVKNIVDENVKIITSKDIEKIGKRDAKKLARENDIFLAEPKLMPLVGKYLGFTLGPRGKMPKPLVGNIEKIIEDSKNSVRLRIKENPQIQCKVGLETDNPDNIVENIFTIVNFLLTKYPKDKIKSIMIKKTMSKPLYIYRYGE